MKIEVVTLPVSDKSSYRLRRGLRAARGLREW
jgi:hypothetical protein